MKHVHFIGIGGISMSALAQIMNNQGFKVSGSDATKSEITEKLEGMGIKVFYGHSPSNLENPDIIVYTAAISNDNVELIKAKELSSQNPDIMLMDRATLLGKIMKEFKHSICISGTDGKTTTTSLIATIMLNALLDPTVHVGGNLDVIGGNVRAGKSSIFITEACEYVESFLKFFPYIGIILNVEEDHLDYYKDINDIKRAFTAFGNLIPADGCCIYCQDNKNATEVTSNLKCKKISYSIKDFKASDSSNFLHYSARNITYDEIGRPVFDVYENEINLGTVSLSVFGNHNISNALAAIACARLFNVEFAVIQNSLKTFKGAHRRFEFKGYCNEAAVIDDYAHNPAEIKAVLEASRFTKHNNIVVVFQPHLYSRTKLLLNEFGNAFESADEIIITDIYAAREKDTGLIHSKDLVQLLQSKNNNKKITYISKFEEIEAYLKENLKKNDLLLTIGAGTVYKIGEKIAK